MSNVIAWPNGDGGVSITIPAQGADIHAVEAAILPSAVPRAVVSVDNLPDAAFRAAWRFNLELGAVVDLEAARYSHRVHIRAARAPELEKLDRAFMRAQEDETGTHDIVAKKRALRDAPQAVAITEAADLEALKAAWPSDLLPVSPYVRRA